jgi:hypothetical protein
MSTFIKKKKKKKNVYKKVELNFYERFIKTLYIIYILKVYCIILYNAIITINTKLSLKKVKLYTNIYINIYLYIIITFYSCDLRYFCPCFGCYKPISIFITFFVPQNSVFLDFRN